VRWIWSRTRPIGASDNNRRRRPQTSHLWGPQAQATIRFAKYPTRAGRFPMTMVCGLGLHRRQITFDALEVESGTVWTGRVWQPDRERFRRPLRTDVTERGNGGPVSIAVEGCTGWRYVVEEVVAAGFAAHLAEPADTQGGAGSQAARQDRSQRQPGCCASCWPMVGCRRRGSRRRWCWSGANEPGCTRRWSINARRGYNGSMPSSVSTA